MSIYNIVDFGAIDDGKTINTKCIQNVFNKCRCGDEVVVPRGIFVSGALFIRGGIKLKLEAGAVLKGSIDINDYPKRVYRFEGIEQRCYSSLINVEEGKHEHIEICGQGIIDGSGFELYKKELVESEMARGRVICIQNTNDLVVTGITICNSVAWTMHFIYCSNIKISKVKVFAKHTYDFSQKNDKLTNGDGIIVDSCHNVEIYDCTVDSQDDCVSIKSGKNVEGRRIGIPSSYVSIHDNWFIGGAGVSIGSEMSGGIHNITVERCCYVNVLSLLSVKTNCERGGYISNIMVSDCRLLNCDKTILTKPNYKAAIYIDSFYKSNIDEPFVENIPNIDNIEICRVNIVNCLGKLMYGRGFASFQLKNIRLKDVEAYSVGDVDIKDMKVDLINVYNNGIKLINQEV